MRRAAFAFLMLAFCAAPAHAALNLCNRTSYILYAASAAMAGQKADVRGWTRLVPGDCAVARKEDLAAGRYLVHARSSLAYSGPARAWGGTIPLCVRDTDFTLAQTVPGTCTADGTFPLSFAPLDTGGRHDWTMNFDESPALASLTAAQLAGVRRLLAAVGEKPGPLNGGPDKATGDALARFRKRMHFPPGAGNAELFRALEAEAQKTAAPAGYTVCNDTADSLLVALGQSDAKNGAVSRGWWTVAPRACARAIAVPLSTDAVYLHARRKDGGVVAGGGTKFCTAAAAFEIHGAGNCTARGYGEAGFTRMPTQGRSGMIAHVGGQTGMLK